MLFIRTLFFFFLTSVTFSQNGDFYGKIKFNTNEPAIGAFIIINGFEYYKEISTDINGDFYLKEVPYGNYTFQIHSLNSKPKTVSATLNESKKVVNIELDLSSNSIVIPTDDNGINENDKNGNDLVQKNKDGFIINTVTKGENDLSLQMDEVSNSFSSRHSNSIWDCG